METVKYKFQKGELVLIGEKYPYGQYGIIIAIHLHEMPGKDGWHTFSYEVLTAEAEIINISCSSLKKLNEF